MLTRERVVVHRNVFVSDLLRRPSLPGRAAERARHNAVLLVSQATMRELADVLAEEKFDRYLTVDERAQFIRLIASIAELVPILHPVCECRDRS